MYYTTIVFRVFVCYGLNSDFGTIMMRPAPRKPLAVITQGLQYPLTIENAVSRVGGQSSWSIGEGVVVLAQVLKRGVQSS